MAVRDASDPWVAGEVLQAADLNQTFASKLDLAGGKILQIVRATDSTTRTTTSTSYVDVTGMSVTITPQKSDSALIFFASGWFITAKGTSTNNFGQYRITDSSNNPVSGAERYVFGSEQSGTEYLSGTIVGYATPATTSAVTYKLRFSAASGASITMANAEVTGQLYAIEVSA